MNWGKGILIGVGLFMGFILFLVISLMTHRVDLESEDYYEKDTEKKNIAEVLIKKHRNGPTGDVELFFQPEQTLFRSIDRVHN